MLSGKVTDGLFASNGKIASEDKAKIASKQAKSKKVMVMVGSMLISDYCVFTPYVELQIQNTQYKNPKLHQLRSRHSIDPIITNSNSISKERRRLPTFLLI